LCCSQLLAFHHADEWQALDGGVTHKNNLQHEMVVTARDGITQAERVPREGEIDLGVDSRNHPQEL
jgi:hypothetical protein